MNIIPRNSLFDFDSVFDNFFAPTRNAQSLEGNFTPRVDVREHDDSYEITAELPGVEKDDLSVSLENGILSIEAESRFEDKEEKEGKIVRQERRYGKYIRSFNLGSGVNESDITADFKNGVLTLKAPKAIEAEREKRRIEVS